MVRTLAVFSLTFALLSSLRADDKTAAKQEKLDSAIDEAIRLIEAKDYKGLFNNFAPPEERKSMKPEEVDKIIKEIESEDGKKIVDKLLFELKAIKGVKPAMSENDTKAVFETEKDGKKVKLTFIKVEKLWYIK